GAVPSVRDFAIDGDEPWAVRRKKQVSQVRAAPAGIVEAMQEFSRSAVAEDDAIGHAFAAVIRAENVSGRLPLGGHGEALPSRTFGNLLGRASSFRHDCFFDSGRNSKRGIPSEY